MGKKKSEKSTGTNFHSADSAFDSADQSSSSLKNKSGSNHTANAPSQKSFADRENARRKQASEKSSHMEENPSAHSKHNNSPTDQPIRSSAAHRRNRAGNYIIYYILLGFILTVVFTTLSLTVFFNIETINVSGSSIYTSDQILAAVDARKGNNLIRLNTEKIAKNALSMLTSADSVEVKRHFPNQLDVIVTDGVPTTQISYNGQFYFFSENERLVSISDSAQVNAQVVVGPDPSELQIGQYMSDLSEEAQATFSSWETLQDELQSHSIHDISAIDLSDEVEIKLYYQNRLEITIGTLTDMDAKLTALYAILYESNAIGLDETGTIELSDPDRIYFNNQAGCTPPDGAAQPGWSWTDEYSDTLEESLYASSSEYMEGVAEEAGTASDTEGSAESDAENDGEASSEENSEAPMESMVETSSEESEDTSEDSSTEESSSAYETSDGIRLPQLPSVAGSSSMSSGNAGTTGGTTESVPTGSSESSESSTSSESSSAASVGVAGSSGSSSGGTAGSGFGTQAPTVPSISN